MYSSEDQAADGEIGSRWHERPLRGAAPSSDSFPTPKSVQVANALIPPLPIKSVSDSAHPLAAIGYCFRKKQYLHNLHCTVVSFKKIFCIGV